jgi:hypothetical protein
MTNQHETLPELTLDVTCDEEKAREQVVDCAVAWANDPSRVNTRDLRAAVEILRLAENGAPEEETAEWTLADYRAQLRHDSHAA